MKKLKSHRINQNVGLVFSLPFIIGLIIFFIPTVIMGIRFAFSEVSIANGLTLKFNGFTNIHYALRVDADFFKLAFNDIKDQITTLPIVIVMSLFVAVLLNGKVWGRSAFRVIFFFPVIACVGMLASSDSGVVMNAMNDGMTEEGNAAFSALSDISLMLQSLNFSPEFISIVSGAANNIVDIINRSGVQILIFLAGIQSISPSIYESANVEGASAWETFWKITLPMITPMMVANILFTFVDGITRDNTQLMKYVKSVAFSKGQFGYSAAMSWIHYLMLLVVLGIIGAVALIVIKRNARNRGGVA